MVAGFSSVVGFTEEHGSRAAFNYDRLAAFATTSNSVRASTAFRVIDKIASMPGMLDALERAHARAREQVWKLTGPPAQVTIDVDATLLSSHSDKEGAAGNLPRRLRLSSDPRLLRPDARVDGRDVGPW